MKRIYHTEILALFECGHRKPHKLFLGNNEQQLRAFLKTQPCVNCYRAAKGKRCLECRSAPGFHKPGCSAGDALCVAAIPAKVKDGKQG